jgi:predicted ATP-grasp superfamily ATP-dependent carboligase
VFQEVLENNTGRLVSIFFYVSPVGEFRSVAIQRERMIPYWGGVASLISLTQSKSTRLIQRFLEDMNYCGLGEIDLYESKERIAIFDLNVRLSSWAFFAEKCGTDLIGPYMRDLGKGQLSFNNGTPGDKQGQLKAIDIMNDIFTSFHPKEGILVNNVITLRQYIRSLRGVKCFYILSLNDVFPFLYRLGSTLSYEFARIIKMLRYTLRNLASRISRR